jgi:hypothetical protein
MHHEMDKKSGRGKSFEKRDLMKHKIEYDGEKA